MDGISRKEQSRMAYLAGAGVSIPMPSALPGAAVFISLLVETITKDPKLRAAILTRTFTAGTHKRFEGDFLRFETVMSGIKLIVDPDLDLLQIYSDCTISNSYHFYLANQLERGAIILTTNFDNLIETACRIHGIDYSLIVSDDELAAFCTAPESFKNPLIKLHGGHNLMESTGTRRHGAENVKTTLEQVGRVYLNDSFNQIAATLATVLRNRHLIVMGYSGCDDFDIMPCIMKEELPNGLTWIDHGSDQPPNILLKYSAELPNLPPYRLLSVHDKEGPSGVKVIRGNTAEIIGIGTSDPVTRGRFDWKHVFAKWAKKHLYSEAQRKLLLGYILSVTGYFKESAEILEGTSSKALPERQIIVKGFMLSNLYVVLNDRDRAILSLSEMANAEQEINGLSLRGFAYYNLARINTDMAQYGQAEMYLNAAMKIFTQLDDAARISDCLHERGRLLTQIGNNDQALKNIELSVQISDAIGDLSGTATGYIEITRALYNQGRLSEAENYARKAISLFTLDGNLVGLGGAYHALGYILALRKDFAGAAREFTQAIEYERSAAAKLDLAHSLHSLGDMYGSMKDFDKAQECLEESLKIKREIKDNQGIANSELLLKGIQALKAGGSE